MTAIQELIRLYSKQLRTPTFNSYRELIRDAEEHGWGYEQFLCELLKTEVDQRQENQQRRRIKQAGFPLEKTLDAFDFTHLPQLNAAQILEIADGRYIEEKRNLIMIGNAGTGKTHLATGLGIRACTKGYRVRFFGAARLVNELTEAQGESRLLKLEKQLSKCDLLIVDELSYLTFSRSCSELLFQVLSDRLERASTIITTNLEFSKWIEVFEDSTLTAALVDRITHRCHVFDMNGPSYRLKEAMSGLDPKRGSDGGNDETSEKS